jgi:hypothetical protein
MPKSIINPDNLKSRFKSPYVRKRLSAVRTAARFLEMDNPDPEILTLLEHSALQDKVDSVRQLALDTIHHYLETLPLKTPKVSKMRKIRVLCSKGHVSYFNKDEICGSQEKFLRVRRKLKKLDDILLKCKHCGEAMVVQVDCEDGS